MYLLLRRLLMMLLSTWVLDKAVRRWPRLAGPRRLLAPRRS